MKNPIETSADQARKYEEHKAKKAERLERANEIRSALRVLESERQRLLNSSPEAEALGEQMKADIEHLQREFVSELIGKARTGRSARIRFDSPGAMAFINRDRWLAAIPELASQVAGDQRHGGRTIADINIEMMSLRVELGSLGAFE